MIRFNLLSDGTRTAKLSGVKNCEGFMSEDRANLDVEDVLSSIRRLVTQDGRLPGSGQAGPSALVLTPAYRVPETADTPSAARDDTPAVPSTPDSLVDAIVELEAAVSGIDASFEPDLDAATDPAQAPAPFAEPFALDSDAEEDAEEDAAHASADSSDAPDAGEGADRDVAQPEVDTDAAAPAVADAGMAEDRAGPFEDAEPEPEGGQAATPDTALQPDVEDPQPQAPLTPSAGMAAPGIDPVMLRLLVSAIVREELQGSLGEKLTDRIRQLVRREIEIAMADRTRQ